MAQTDAHGEAQEDQDRQVFPEKIFHRHPFAPCGARLGCQRWGWRERRDSNPRPPA